MNAYKISVKFFIDDPASVDGHEIVPVLHGWIQRHAVKNHLLIDVADYEHVHNGPGTVLVAHEANFLTDRYDGRLGLTYQRKQPLDGSFEDRLRQAYGAVLEGCQRLEEDEKLAGRVKFRTDESAIRIHDRLLAPNTIETLNAVKPAIEKVAGELYLGKSVDIEHYAGANTLFEVRVRASESPSIDALLNRL